jgi:hypothetical protein
MSTQAKQKNVLTLNLSHPKTKPGTALYRSLFTRLKAVTGNGWPEVEIARVSDLPVSTVHAFHKEGKLPRVQTMDKLHLGLLKLEKRGKRPETKRSGHPVRA